MSTNEHPRSGYPSNERVSRVDGLLGSRWARRVAVLLSAGLMLAGVLVIWFDDPAATSGWLHAGYLLLGALAVGGYTLLSLVMRAYRAGDDERLLSVRNAAYRRAYLALGVATGAAVLAVSLAWESGSVDFALEPHHLRAMLLAFVAAAVWLPVAVLAWTEPEV